MVQNDKSQILRYLVSVRIHDKPLTMLVDTGSSISIIPEEMAEQVYYPKVDTGEAKTNNNFQYFNGNPVEQTGVLRTVIELNNWKVEGAELMITPREQNKMPLLAADLIRRLGLKLTQAVEAPPQHAKGQKQISNVNPDLQTKSQAEFKNLFSRQGKKITLSEQNSNNHSKQYNKKVVGYLSHSKTM